MARAGSWEESTMIILPSPPEEPSTQHRQKNCKASDTPDHYLSTSNIVSPHWSLRVAKLVVVNLFQLYTQRSSSGRHWLTSIRALRFTCIATPNFPASDRCPSVERSTGYDHKRSQTSWDNVQYIIPAGHYLAQIFIFTMVADHRIKGVDQAIK